MASATWGHLRDLFGAGTVVGLGDGALLARYASGRDGAAFEALVARHGPMVLATCRAVLKHEHDVEDAFQATFLVLARKAGSIRGGDALGGWLHRVAYRAAVGAIVEARRRREKEAEAATMAPPAGTRPDPGWQAVLHEEIERLPESRRLPVVLCDLEGLTYDEAARRLGWTVPTLRSRLAKARQKLRDRLTRRGVSEKLALPIAPMVPAALARSAISAAAGGPASAGATILTHTILKGLFMTRLKIASTAAMAAVGLAAAGLVAAGAFRADGPPIKPAEPPKAAEVAPPSDSKPGEVDEVRGIVVDAAGKPVAGAVVRTALLNAEGRPDPETTAGPDGRFLLRVPRPTHIRRAPDDRYPFVVASAPGFGPGWAEGIFKVGPPGGLTVRLAEEGPPIEGRVVDLEGRPVAGAGVEVESTFHPSDGKTLDDWIARAKDRGLSSPGDGLKYVPTSIAATNGPDGRFRPTVIAATTGPDGRFRLAGIGRDRVADLHITGPTIASAKVHVVTRDGSGFSAVNLAMMPRRSIVFQPPRFEHVVEPTKRVEGVARDRDTGRPISGLTIGASVFDDRGYARAPRVLAMTDADGRYRLTGLRRSSAYRLEIVPAKGQPYFEAEIRVAADSPALEPVPFDFTLKRGVVVRGRATDKETGRPASGTVEAYTFPDNPHLAEYQIGRVMSRVYSDLDADGRFELVTLPGRWIVACRSADTRYRRGVGAEAIGGIEPTKMAFPTMSFNCYAYVFHVLAEVVLDAKALSATQDFQLDPGRSLKVAIVDPEGRPIAGTTATGLREPPDSTDTPDGVTSVEVRYLAPGHPRRVTVTHKGRKLVGSIYLKGDEQGPLTLRLRPWGEITGRVVDQSRRPFKDLKVFSLGGLSPDRPEIQGILPGGTTRGGIPGDKDGRFHVEGLVPGLKYAATAGEELPTHGVLFRELIVAPGEVQNLGDLWGPTRLPGADLADDFRADGPAMKPAAREQAEAPPGPPPGPKLGEPVEVRGIVVDPGGRPVAGATVRTAFHDWVDTPNPETTADADGRFLLRVPKTTRPRSGLDAARYPFVVASAPGFGLGWIEGAFKEAPTAGFAVKLAEEGPPIEGRVVDLEGRPVAGAGVKVETAWHPFGGKTLDAWIAEARDRGLQGPWQGMEGIPTTIAATTGPDGRFRLAGVGPDRVAGILITGPTIASAQVFAITRDGAGFSATIRPMMTPVPIVYRSPKFEHVAVPTRWVEGVARDKDTGRPIVGLSVQASVADDRGHPRAPDVVARTDEQGRYRLIGLPGAPAYRLSTSFIPGKGQPYPRATLRAPADSPAPGPVNFDLALKRGIIVRGRILDQVTGKPVVGYVHAYTFPDNPHLGDFPGFARSSLLNDPVDAEGRYELVCPPGRVLLAARSELGDYRGAVGEGLAGYDAKYQSFKTLPTWCILSNYHAVAEATLDPRAEVTTVDIRVAPGRTVPVTAIDPEGRPIGGTVAKGIGDLFQSTNYPQESASFEVHALDPSKPRRVIVTHFGRKLVGSAYLKGDEAGPVTIRLQPWGAVAGRIVDAEGAPRKGMELRSLGGSNPDRTDVNGILPEGDRAGGIVLGADGRFRVEGLVPGLRYGGTAVEGFVTIGDLFEGVIVAPGEVRELGDLKVIPPKPEAH